MLNQLKTCILLMRRGINHTNLFNFLKRVSAFIFNLLFNPSNFLNVTSNLFFKVKNIRRASSNLLNKASNYRKASLNLFFKAKNKRGASPNLLEAASSIFFGSSSMFKMAFIPQSVFNKPYFITKTLKLWTYTTFQTQISTNLPTAA